MKKSIHIIVYILFFIFSNNLQAELIKGKNGCLSEFNTDEAKKMDVDISAEWDGPCVNGKADGHGIQVVSGYKLYHGSQQIEIFDGIMKDGLRVNGKIKTLNSGNTYSGTFKNGLWDGEGVFTNQDFEYKGSFSREYLNGFGVKKYKSGKVEMGLWEKNKLVVECSDKKNCNNKKLEKNKAEAKTAAENKRKAAEAARKMAALGQCEIGSTVYHREIWDGNTSSGNIIADVLFNATIKESFVIEFEGVVKGFLGKKVEVYLQDYTIKQTKGGGILQTATGVKAEIIEYADKRIGKSFFFDKSRCTN